MPCIKLDNMDGVCGLEWLSNELNLGTHLLILDCRSASEYNTSHVRGSIHVAIPSLMLRRLKKGNLNVSSVISCNEGKERFNKKCQSERIVLYDDSTSALNANPSSVVSLLIKKLKEDGCDVCLLEGGFSSFNTSHPQLCMGQNENEESTIFGLRNLRISEINCESEEVPSPTNTYPFPVEVIDHLFLGNAKNAGDLLCLERNNIKYILNVTPNIPNMFENEGTFKYMQIPIKDHWSQNLSSFFEDAIRFIDEARSQKVGILVHCLAGISRSVTVTVAYLMSRMSLSLNEAYDKVKECKPNISPNFNFMGQLLDLEKKLSSPDKCECCKEMCTDSPDSQSTCTTCQCSNSTTFFTTPTKPSPTLELQVVPS